MEVNLFSEKNEVRCLIERYDEGDAMCFVSD